MKRTVSAIAVLLLAAGLHLMFYPALADARNNAQQRSAVDSYAEAVKALDPAVIKELWDIASATGENTLDIDRSGMIGCIEIPALDLLLPIYQGTDEDFLQSGIGHPEWSSLPVGGEGSHCVLTGHRGLPGARLFTDLDRLVPGDVFLLHVLGKTLAYEVDQIHIAEPQDTKELMIREGEDLCTLVTCTPYGINSHRLLVRGRRIGGT